MNMIETVTALGLSLFPALMIAAGLTDLTTMTIPNRISAALIVAFYPVALLVQLPASTVLVCTGLGLAGLVVGAGMFALRWIGGGDAKLLAGGALWLGASALPTFLFWTALVGGLFGLSLLMVRQWAQPYAGLAPRWVGRLLEPRGAIPYGVAIASGALAAFPESPILRGFSGLF